MKNDFELMILIYLFTKKGSFNLFSINDLIQFHLYLIFKKKSYLYLLYQKNLLQNLNLATKIILLVFLENNEFLQFYLQKYFDSFSFKKNDFYKLFKTT